MQTKVTIKKDRASKPFDVSLISSKTIEALLKFIDCVPEEVRVTDFDKTLNKQRLDVAGAQPDGKLRYKLVPQRLNKTIAKSTSDLKALPAPSEAAEEEDTG